MFATGRGGPQQDVSRSDSDISSPEDQPVFKTTKAIQPAKNSGFRRLGGGRGVHDVASVAFTPNRTHLEASSYQMLKVNYIIFGIEGLVLINCQ